MQVMQSYPVGPEQVSHSVAQSSHVWSKLFQKVPGGQSIKHLLLTVSKRKVELTHWMQ